MPRGHHEDHRDDDEVQEIDDVVEPPSVNVREQLAHVGFAGQGSVDGVDAEGEHDEQRRVV